MTSGAVWPGHVGGGARHGSGRILHRAVDDRHAGGGHEAVARVNERARHLLVGHLPHRLLELQQQRVACPLRPE